MKNIKRPGRFFSAVRSWPFQVLIACVLVAIVYMAWPEVSASFDNIREADGLYLKWAVIAYAASYVTAPFTYFILCNNKISYNELVIVQIASGCTNRLLPSGTGSLALYTSFLTARKIPVAKAAAISTMNNVIGFIGNIVLLALAVFVFRFEVGSYNIRERLVRFGLLGAILLVLFLCAPFLKKTIFRPVRSFFTSYLRTVFRLLKEPRIVAGALIPSMLTTLSHTSCLWFCLQAVGVHLSLGHALIAMSTGAVVGAAVPTPGGLGSLETGMVATLALFGYSVEFSTAGVLLYRLITYWGPIIPGYISLAYLSRSSLIKPHA